MSQYPFFLIYIYNYVDESFLWLTMNYFSEEDISFRDDPQSWSSSDNEVIMPQVR